jgi:hypothetical protein
MAAQAATQASLTFVHTGTRSADKIDPDFTCCAEVLLAWVAACAAMTKNGKHRDKPVAQDRTMSALALRS